MGFRYVVEEMGLPFPTPFVLEMDNAAAKIFCEGNAKRTKLKHIDTRQEWVLTLRDRGIMIPSYVDTDLNLADIFTKILPGPRFEQLRAMCMFRRSELD